MGKKGEWSVEKIAGMVIILIAVVLILLVYPAKIWDAAKTALGFGEDELNIVVIDENAYSGFEGLIKNVNSCRGFKEDGCGCKIELNNFYKTHQLLFSDSGVQMRNIRERTDTLMGDSSKLQYEGLVKSSKGLNCYIDKNGMEIKGQLIIKFDDKGAYAVKENSVLDYVGLGDDMNNWRVNGNFQLLKNKGNVCWILNSYINTVKSCS